MVLHSARKRHGLFLPRNKVKRAEDGPEHGMRVQRVVARAQAGLYHLEARPLNERKQLVGAKADLGDETQSEHGR